MGTGCYCWSKVGMAYMEETDVINFIKIYWTAVLISSLSNLIKSMTLSVKISINGLNCAYIGGTVMQWVDSQQ